MHLVDDEHLVAVAHGRNREPADDHLADVLDPGVGGGIDLEHVHVAAARNFPASVADPAGIGRGALIAVQGAGEQPRGGRLPHAARPREHERLVDASTRERVAECLRDGLLPDDLVEALGPPLAGEDGVHERADVFDCG